MAFVDDPIIDKNSIRSEKSVLAVRSLFTRENKYIFKEEFIDNGIDANIELLDENSRATSKIFAIQIKSKANVSIINYNDAKFISFPFETSRLGYLCRRPPTYGLIFIYDDQTQKCYFGYVEEIVAELDKHPNRSGWRNQETVSILISELAELNSDSIKDIHSKMTIRHSAHDNLVKFHGANYGIPVINSIPKSEFDFNENDSTEVASFLSKYGWALYNQGEYTHLNRLIKSVNHVDINKPELLLLSAVQFAQVGNTIECEYYLRKAKVFLSKFSPEQVGIYNFTVIRCDFLKGDINLSEYLEKLETFKQGEFRKENQITLEINLIFLKLVDQVTKGFNREIISEISQLFEKISEYTTDTRNQKLLTLYHSENLHLFALNLLLHNFQALKLKESMGIPIGLTQRINEMNEFFDLRNRAVKISQDIYEDQNEDDSFVKALSAYYLSKFFKDTCFQNMLMGVLHDDRPKTIRIYEWNNNLALEAYNSFIIQGLFQNAHSALSTAIEIRVLCRKICKASIGEQSEDELIRILKDIELKNDLKAYDEVVTPAYDGMSKTVIPDKRSYWLNLSEETMEKLADAYISHKGIPEERKINLIEEMKSYKKFHSICTNKNIELLVDTRPMASINTMYKEPSKFILKHQILGIESKPSCDISELIDEFSTIINNE